MLGDLAASICCELMIVTAAGTLSTSTPVPASGVDVVMGIGGSAEGVLAAAALKCVGGDLQAQFSPRDAEEEAALKAAGYARRDQVLRVDDFVRLLRRSSGQDTGQDTGQDSAQEPAPAG